MARFWKCKLCGKKYKTKNSRIHETKPMTDHRVLGHKDVVSTDIWELVKQTYDVSIEKLVKLSPN